MRQLRGECEHAVKDLELQLRIRNNRLKERRLTLGLTRVALAEKAGVPTSTYVSLENLKLSPLCKYRLPEGRGAAAWSESLVWSTSATKLAAFYMVPPEELWPAAILAVRKNVIETKVDAATLLLARSELVPQQLPSPEDIAEQSEQVRVVGEALMHLTQREQRVLHMHFGIGCDGEYTLAEIGQDFEVTGSRIMQIERKALRKLRHPRTSKPLKDVW